MKSIIVLVLLAATASAGMLSVATYPVRHFETELEAKQARDQAELMYRSDFRRENLGGVQSIPIGA